MLFPNKEKVLEKERKEIAVQTETQSLHMADSPTMTDMSTRYTMNFAGRVLYTDVGSQQFVETVIHNDTDHILKSHGLLKICDITTYTSCRKLHHCNVEGVWGVKTVLFFQCLLFCGGGDAAVTASLALFLDKW